MATGMIGCSFLLLGALLVMALRFEFNMPISLSLLLSIPALALGAMIAHLVSELSGVSMWRVVTGMSIACFLVAVWSESRTGSASL